MGSNLNKDQFRLYHATEAEIEGAELKPAAETGKGLWNFEQPEHAWRGQRVWMSRTPREAYNWVGGKAKVYEVEPAPDVVEHLGDQDDEESLDYGMTAQFHASRARILRQVPNPYRELR